MVQVDVFWGYGWGASLAAACGKQLAREKAPLESRYFVATLLFLSLCWAPTGMLLLLRHPSWETMQVARSFGDISEWLVLGFGITNVTQGILGFWVGQKLAAAGRPDLARLNWVLGYFGMFFILLYGWDGLGYDRFLYDRDMLPGSPAWTPGAGTHEGVLPALLHFLNSGVAHTLYLDGLYLLPPFFLLAARWEREGAAPGAQPSAVRVVARYLGGALGLGLGGAALAAGVVWGAARLLGVGDPVARALGQAPAHTAQHVAAYLVGLPLACLVLWRLRPRRVAD